MTGQTRVMLTLVGTLAVVPFAGNFKAVAGPQAPTVKIPEAGVPQIMTLEGAFVRAAYNNEGYVILGYRAANASVGTDWLLLEIGATMRDGKPSVTLKRDALSLETPDGKTLPLAPVEAYRAANLQALQKRNEVMRDKINYFPPSATQACRIGFFSDTGGAVAWDQVELSSRRACVGQLYFQVPGGIAYGQHWLNVKLAESVVRVPFKILTKDEEKLLTKNYSNIKKQVDAAFKPPKKDKK